MEVNSCIWDIQGSENWVEVHLVGGGWSNDEKYHIITKDKNEILLRLSNIKELEQKKKEYEILEKLKSCGIKNFPEPYVFKTLPEHGKVYMLLRWLKGGNVEEVIKNYCEKDRYKLGNQAGEVLKMMHTLPARITSAERQKFLMDKFEARNKKYEAGGYNIKNYKTTLDFIRSNTDVFFQRATTFLHGDYQGRNIVISPDAQVGVIDFNRICEGDPYDDFNRLVQYTRFFDIDFSRGQIDGYFNEKVPEDFFRAVLFYTGIAALTSLNYGLIENDTKVVEAMVQGIDQIVEDTNGYRSLIPKWYKK